MGLFAEEPDLLAYQPEQSTAIFIPTLTQNLVTGLWSWTSTSAALSPTGNGATITVSGSGNSSMLTCTGFPAGALDAINGDALITKFSFQQQGRVQRTGIYAPESKIFLMKNGVVQANNNAITQGTDPLWSALDTSIIVPTGTLFGAAVKAGTYGPGYRIESIDSNVAGTSDIRGVTMQVFYQNPIPSGGTLLLCEA